MSVTPKLKSYEEAQIMHLINNVDSELMKSAIKASIDILGTVLLEADDENCDSVSTRALWTAIMASDGYDSEAFIVSILSDYFTEEKNPKTLNLTVPYNLLSAAKTLAEDKIYAEFYERLSGLLSKYQAIAVYRSMYRLANIITYPPINQSMILNEVSYVKNLDMTPTLYALYDLVYTQAFNIVSLMDNDYLCDEEDLDLDDDEELDERLTNFARGSEILKSEDIDKLEEDTKKQNFEKVKGIIFSISDDESIDEAVAKEFNISDGGIIILPKENINYISLWRMFVAQNEAKPLDWITHFDLKSDIRWAAKTKNVENTLKVIMDELKEGSLLTLHRRVAEKLGISENEYVFIPYFGDAVYHGNHGFISHNTGEVITLSNVDWATTLHSLKIK